MSVAAPAASRTTTTVPSTQGNGPDGAIEADDTDGDAGADAADDDGDALGDGAAGDDAAGDDDVGDGPAAVTVNAT